MFLSLEDQTRCPWEELFPGVLRQVVDGTRMTLTRYRFLPRARFPEHHHEQEQLTLVIEGELDLTVGEETFTCRAHDVVVVPPGRPHGATAGPDGALFVSIVSPPRHGAGFTFDR